MIKPCNEVGCWGVTSARPAQSTTRFIRLLQWCAANSSFRT